MSTNSFQGKYTTKSDVWSFAVTLWEILNLGRRVPYEHLGDEEVVHCLRRLCRDCSASDEASQLKSSEEDDDEDDDEKVSTRMCNACILYEHITTFLIISTT